MNDPGLTRREFEVYMLIVERAQNEKKIGLALGISRNTVLRHTQQIYDKMGCFSRLGLLVQYHRREGNLPPLDQTHAG
jgi:DNA-binding CsgD family transcriptional regulator